MTPSPVSSVTIKAIVCSVFPSPKIQAELSQYLYHPRNQNYRNYQKKK